MRVDTKKMLLQHVSVELLHMAAFHRQELSTILTF
jgi:hypothetical protein